MTTYKSNKFRTTAGMRYEILRKQGKDWVVLSRPQYYKTKAGAERAIKSRLKKGI